MSREKSAWQMTKEQNPAHAQWYIQRFRSMEEQGKDIWGEARTIDAMAPRNARILDAGCGMGRLGARLHENGHRVTGVDLDPELIEEAQRVFPEAHWVVSDLADLRESLGYAQETQLGEEGFDVVFSAGNVMTFLAPSTRREVLEELAAVLAPAGRAVIGFGAGRGYEFADFFEDAAASGLKLDNAFSTWELHPFNETSTFLVAILSKA